MVGRKGSVYERAQATGYVTGPSHRVLNTRKQAEEPAKVPAPNYRQADDISQTCSSCMHYDFENRQCGKYQFAAKPQMVCDGYEASSEMAGDSPVMPTMETMT